MNVLSKQPIGKQLAIGFGLVALIALLLGGMGYYGADKNEKAMQEVGNIRMPSIDSVLQMEIEIRGVIQALRTLLNPALDMEVRRRQYRLIDEHRQGYRAALDVYTPLPHTPEETHEWNAFMRILPEWVRFNEQILELHRELDRIGILNPDELLSNLQRFRGDHYALEVQVGNMLLTGQIFEGGDDASACAFGRWLSTFTSNNPELTRILDHVRRPHGRFHEALDQIRNAVRAQNMEAATRIFTQTMQPASQEVFQHFDQMIVMVEQAETLQGRITEMTMGASRDMQHQASTHLGNVVKINHEITAREVPQAISQATSLKIISLAATVIGVLMAIVFGFFIRGNVAGTLKDILTETNNLVDAAVGGKLATRAKTQGIHPEFRPIAEGFNNVLDAVIGPLNVAAEYVDRISKGDIPPTIKDTYNGDFNEIKNNLNQCIEAVNLLVQDTKMLSVAAVQGKLATRADASRHQGDFRAVVTGVNETLDAVIGPLNVAAEYVDRISKGDIPPIIKDSYNGDFNEIKNNLNQCIESLNGLIGQMNHMADEHDRGDIDVVIAADQFQGAYRTMAKGVNDMVNGHITVKKKAMACVKEFGDGNFDAVLEKFPGKKVFINEIVEQVRANIKGFIDDMGRMSEQHDLGDIDVIMPEEKFKGAYRTMAKGVNDMVNGHITVKKKAIACVTEFGRGNFEAPLEKFPGKKAFINESIEQVRANLKALIADADMLADAAIAGKLATRANASRHHGDFQKIITGFNNTLDAVIGPLNVAAEYVDRISKGDVPPRITDSYSGDFNEIKNNLNLLIDAMNEVTDVATEISAGNLTVRVRERSAQDKLIQAMGTMVGGLTEVASNIQTVAAQVMMGSQEMNASSEQLSQGATEQSASVEEVSSSMEEMAANIKQNSDNARQTEKIALKAAEDAMEGGQAVSQTVSAMKEIAGKISIIEEIARQTNLLALNAAIEAARAGEHGKGFAVVASEVRKLAERSQTAAGEINTLSASSVQVAEKAGEMLAGIVPNIQKTADLVQEITAASNEQSSGADQINKAIQQLDHVVQQNASAAEEMASTSTELLAQAEQLQTTIAFFRIDGSGRAGAASSSRNPSFHGNTQRKLDPPHGKMGEEMSSTGSKAIQPSGKSKASKGIFLDMGKGAQSDAIDEEFERY